MGRTAGAVGGLADSGAIVRLTRGQLWIGALAVLLVGIVALNVFALRFNAASGEAAGQAEELAQRNSALRSALAAALSPEEMLRAAEELGLVLPPPGDLRYREPKPGDAAEAARRLREGELTGGPGTAPAAPVADPATLPGATEPPPAVPAPVTEPPATETAVPEAPDAAPAAEEPAAAPPAPPAPAPAGGIAAQ